MISQERTLSCDGNNGTSPVQLPPETKIGIDLTGYIAKPFHCWMDMFATANVQTAKCQGVDARHSVDGASL